MRGDFEQDFRLHTLGLYRRDLGAALAEGAGLVKGDGADGGCAVHGAAAVIEHAVFRGAAHGAQPDERHCHIERAGARQHQQHSGAADGFINGNVKDKRQQHQHEDGGDGYDGRKIGLYPGEGAWYNVSPLRAVLHRRIERCGGGIGRCGRDFAAELALAVYAA